ncbi:MAG: glycosyltransferase [Patescibacteria group bacterium]
MPKPFLSVIIPAYNEEKRLPLTLIDIDKHLSRAEYSYEIIVLNDGSVDSTAEIVKRFGNIVKNLRLIDNQENRGEGAVVRQGMLSAKGNWRLFLGAHNSVSIDHFNKMTPYFSAGGGSAFGRKESYDVVIGSRGKRIIGGPGNLIIRKFILKGPWDTRCGFQCFSEEAANRIFRLTRINRSAFNIEILALANFLGFRIKEIPVKWAKHKRFRTSFKNLFSTFFDVIKIWWRLKKGKYQN